MSRESWIREFHWELRRRRLPWFYVSSTVREFTDHIDDLFSREKQMSEQAFYQRMGSPIAAANQAADEFSFPTWLGRHPWLCFVIAPIPLLLLAMYGYMCLMILAVGTDFAESHRSLATWGWKVITYIPPMFYALYYMAWRHSQRSVWWIVPVSLGTIYLSLALMSQVMISPNPGESQVSIGLVSSAMPFFTRPWAVLRIPFWLSLIPVALIIRQQLQTIRATSSPWAT